MAKNNIEKYANRGNYEVAVPGKLQDLTAVVDIGIESLKRDRGRIAVYPDDEQGLNDFISKSLEYLQHIRAVNADSSMERVVFPDIESWCAFIGVTRTTIFNYYHSRGDEWKEGIDKIRTIIASAKKQLAFSFKVPPVIAMFDLANNHGYINSSEFKITPVEVKKKEETASIEEMTAAAGLRWDEDLQDYVEDV